MCINLSRRSKYETRFMKCWEFVMPETIDVTLMESLSEAIETMAFMMVMEPEEELPTPKQSVHVKMSFAGPVSGELEMLAGEKFTQMLAANLIGIEPDDEEAQSKGVDAFKELLNTVCGVLLPQLATSPADEFDVTVPTGESYDLQQWQSFVAEPGVMLLDVDFNPVAARLKIL